MSSINSISPQKLARLVGVPHGPALIDVRTDDDFGDDPRFIPGALRRSHETAASWTREFAGRSTVVICQKGQKLSEGVAAWLRHAHASSAEVLAGGHTVWAEAGLPLVPQAKLPPRDGQGRTVWVTRARPKVDRIACPWLIRRFVDPVPYSSTSPLRKCRPSRRVSPARRSILRVRTYSGRTGAISAPSM
jgi:rhodanese-related sulfurtransferase